VHISFQTPIQKIRLTCIQGKNQCKTPFIRSLKYYFSMNKNFTVLIITIVFLGLLYNCRIDPLVSEGFGITPCEPNVVYFEKDILPLLQSNCAKSGCHDTITAQSGVILNNYDSIIVTGEIKQGKPDSSKLFILIEEDIMPFGDNQKLTSEQKSAIETWILQGAINNRCDNCDTSDITFSQNIYPIIQTRCEGCHSGGDPRDDRKITNYSEIETIVLSGELLGVIQHDQNYTAMPYNLPKLPKCEIEQIILWIEDGWPDN